MVAPHVPLARGWERQLDVSDNALFYRPGLSASAYRAWLTAAGVRWVALPDAPLDYSARAESRLIRGGLSYLRPAWRSAHWRVYAVRGGASLVVGPGRVTALRARSFAVRVRRAGRVTIAVRFTPYWAIVAGRGCVTPGAGGRTALDVPRAERVEVAVRFALGRIGADGPRCRRSPGASR